MHPQSIIVRPSENRFYNITQKGGWSGDWIMANLPSFKNCPSGGQWAEPELERSRRKFRKEKFRNQLLSTLKFTRLAAFYFAIQINKYWFFKQYFAEISHQTRGANNEKYKYSCYWMQKANRCINICFTKVIIYFEFYFRWIISSWSYSCNGKTRTNDCWRATTTNGNAIRDIDRGSTKPA